MECCWTCGKSREWHRNFTPKDGHQYISEKGYFKLQQLKSERVAKERALQQQQRQLERRSQEFLKKSKKLQVIIVDDVLNDASWDDLIKDGEIWEPAVEAKPKKATVKEDDLVIKKPQRKIRLED